MIMYFVWMGVIFLILTVSILDGMAPAVSIVVAIIALIGVVISAIYSNRKLGETLNTKRMESKGEHTGLGKDHTSLSNEHNRLLDKINHVDNTAEYLKDEAIKADALKQHLPKQDLDLTFAFKQMTAIMEESAALRLENQRLREEVEHLRTLEHEHKQVHESENER